MKYTGVGARVTPREMLGEMYSLGERYGLIGAELRSGGALGPDSAFESGADAANGPKKIFLPWQKYNNNTSPLFEAPDAAFEMLDIIVPEAKKRSDSVRGMFARNCMQVMGETLDDPSEFVACWMKTKAPVGGTGVTVRIAQYFNIPVFNLKYDMHLLQMFF